MKKFFVFLSALLCMTGAFSSCAKPALPSENVGVGCPAELLRRDNPSDTLPGIDEPISDLEDFAEPQDPSENTSEDTNTDKNNNAETPAQPENPAVPAAPAGKMWELTADGKYKYSFASPDRSSLSDLSDIYSTPKALFNDQGDDYTASWYFGKTSYDESTGSVTYVWDRTAETKALIDNNLGIYRGDETRNVCYFTFDCGYENGYTDPILDTLKSKGVAGVFFITGQYVETAKPQIRRMIDEGHIIGNHTVDHPNMTQLESPNDFIDQIEGLEDMVKSEFPDSQPILYYRPPYGAANEWTLKLAAKMGIRTVEWSFTYKDYDPEDQLPYADALAKCKSGLHPGVVYLFHTVSRTNSEILPELIDWIRSQGYEILPVCDIK